MATTQAALKPAFRQRRTSPDAESLLRSTAEKLGAAFRRYSEQSFGLEIATRPARTQVVHVEVDHREQAFHIRSRVGRFSRSIRPRALLTLGSEFAFGRICIEDVLDGGGITPFIMVKAGCAIRPADLVASLSLTAWTADEIERRLFGHDVE